MKYLPFIVICLVSCQSKNTTEEKKDSVVAEEAPPENVYYSSKETPGGTSDTPTIKLTSSIENFDIFIDAGTSLYTGASLESEIVKELTEFTPSVQIQRTSAREPEDYGTCSHYFWYEVKLNDGTKGWVYGASVEIKSEANNASAGTAIEVKGKKYTLDFLEDTGIGPSDENGLTGCSSYSVPYFFNSEENTMHFIKTNSSQLEGAQGLFLSSYLNWIAMESSEGGSVSIVGMELNEEETELTIKLSAGYQEGGANGQLVVSVDNGLFELYNFSIDPQDSPHGEESDGDEPEGEQDTPDYQ